MCSLLSADQGDSLHKRQGNGGFGMLARNLPGTRSSLGIAQNSLGKRPGPAMRGTLHPRPPKIQSAERGLFRITGSFSKIVVSREGANREKLTVKKLIDNEMFFFSPFMSLTNREKSAQTVKQSAPNREKIGAKNPPFFHCLRLLEFPWFLWFPPFL